VPFKWDLAPEKHSLASEVHFFTLKDDRKQARVHFHRCSMSLGIVVATDRDRRIQAGETQNPCWPLKLQSQPSDGALPTGNEWKPGLPLAAGFRVPWRMA